MGRVALQGTITSPSTGQAAPSATITIRDNDGSGALSTVYAARTGTTEVNNPLSVGDTGLTVGGELDVYLEPGLYHVAIDTGGVVRTRFIEAIGYSVNLEALSNLSGVADRVPYFTGPGAMSLAAFSSFGRSLVDDASASAARTTLGLGTAAVAPIVGTVSQSGGVPTGAIIEQGGNANGFYVRFADGTQICWHTFITSSSADSTWTFPIVFLSNRRIFATSESASALFATVTSPSDENVLCNIWNASGVRTSARINTFAIGRWF